MAMRLVLLQRMDLDRPMGQQEQQYMVRQQLLAMLHMRHYNSLIPAKYYRILL